MRIAKDSQVDALTKKAWEENWSGYATEQALEIFNYPRVKRQLEIYGDRLPKDKYILEGGCGIGPYLAHFHGLGYSIIGVDYNVEPLKKIKEFNKNLLVSCADVLRLPFKDSSFGAYISLGVIEHFTEGPQAAIKEAYRVISDKGYFIVQVPRISVLRKIKYPLIWLSENSFIRKLFHKEPKTRYWEQYFAVSELSEALKDGGFLVEAVFPLDHEHAFREFCPFLFGDRKSYDAANKLGVSFGRFAEKFLPWACADSMVFICKKETG